MNYYKKELNKIKVNGEYAPNFKLWDENGECTNMISLNGNSIPILIEWLTKVNNYLEIKGE